MEIITGLLQTSILAGGVLALAALGEVLAERVGVVNLGVEGLMALGAITGIATVITTGSPALGFIPKGDLSARAIDALLSSFPRH